jgi:hypothetical protein
MRSTPPMVKALGALIVQRFFQFCGTTCGVGFLHGKHSELGSVGQRCILESMYNKLLGEKLPRSVFSQFLAKPGAGRAQLGVFGHSEAIEAIYFAF